MTDREERQHVIEVLKQMRLDYEDFWEENDTEEIKAFNYAIASIETDLKYDLLYEQESNCSEIPTGSITKNDLVVDCISRADAIHAVSEALERTFVEHEDIANKLIGKLPSVTPLSSGLEKNSKKLEKDFGESDCISRQSTVKRLCKLAEFLNEHKENSGAPYIVAALFIQDNKTEFPPVTPQEPKTGYCKDCKYFEYDTVAKVDGMRLILAHEICSRWGDGCKTKEDGYCFLFEPKESEKKE